MSMHSTRISGHRGLSLSGDIGGDAAHQPVILLHGGGQTRHSWGKAARDLVGRGFHVMNLDLRGHGESEWDSDGDYSLDAFIGDLRAVIASLERPPALVGASLGGATSLLAVGESLGPLASALVLVDVVPRMSATGIKHIGDFMGSNLDGFASLEEAADSVARYLPGRPRPSNPAGLMKNLRLKDNGRLYWHWDPAFQSNRKQTRAELNERMEAAARKVSIPTLLVRGKQSDVVTREGAAHLLELIPHAEYLDIEGAGHMVAGDRNDQFNDAVEGFLQRHLQAA
ncbi:alpha/beta fold hydrolase [Pseudomonas sp. NY15436]|uniref:alpha/beta fold hydrolase n=1 Tax=Pseudomonas TaxID=286 RepID=UPI001E55833F|nr:MULTISPECIES: alpha/beta hydrolase [Pseudomonas]MCE4071479.1 alpha/beta hydrolase [Pseudomonas nitritireducens]MCE4081255.1 alpha/beta hydrolase [Pseudomonas nitroreducens]